MRRPTLLRGYRELLEKEVVEAWRTYRVGAIAILFALVGILVPVLTRYLPELLRGFAPPDFEIGLDEMGPADIIDQLLRNLVLFGGLAGVLLAMGSVAAEKERGTARLVLATPVRRAAFLWAKFVAMAMLLGLGVGLALLAAWLYTSMLYGQQGALAWAQMALVVWLSTLVYASITFLGSSLLGSPLGAAAIGFAAVVGLSILSAVGTLNPWLPTGLLDVARTIGLDEPSPDLDPARTVAISLAVIALSLSLAWLRFRREDL